MVQIPSRAYQTLPPLFQFKETEVVIIKCRFRPPLNIATASFKDPKDPERVAKSRGSIDGILSSRRKRCRFYRVALDDLWKRGSRVITRSCDRSWIWKKEATAREIEGKIRFRDRLPVFQTQDGKRQSLSSSIQRRWRGSAACYSGKFRF